MHDEYRAAAQRLIEKFRRSGDTIARSDARPISDSVRRDGFVVHSPTDCVFIVNHNYGSANLMPAPPPPPES